jgi:hypothetical protein
MLVLGIGILLFTTAVAVAIFIKANQSVRNFDERKHESFIGSQKH